MLGYRLLKLIFWVASFLPSNWVVSFARFFSRTIGRRSPRERDIARAQLQWAFDRTNHDFESTIDDSFADLGESVAELIYLDEILTPSQPEDHGLYPQFTGIQAQGQDICRELLEKRKPVLALTGHVGNFELLAAFHAKSGAHLVVIGREPNYSSISTFIDEVRSNYGVRGVWRHGKATAGIILRGMHEGNTIAFLIDQDADLDNIFTPFFGLPAASPKAPLYFAVRNKMAIITSFIARVGHLKPTVETQEIVYDPANPDAVALILAEYTRRLETFIRRNPSQWLWWHRRWRRRPGIDYKKKPDALLGSKKYVDWLTALQAERHSRQPESLKGEK